MADELTVSEAAAELDTSVQTIRNYLRSGTLRGSQNPKTGAWRVRRASVDAFLAEHGRLEGGRRRKSAVAALEADVRRLTAHVDELAGALSGDRGIAELIGERDDLRGRVAALEDALAKMREAAELRRKAEVERAQIVTQLLAALAAADRVDGLHRRTLESLEDGLVGSLMPRYPGSAG